MVYIMVLMSLVICAEMLSFSFGMKKPKARIITVQQQMALFIQIGGEQTAIMDQTQNAARVCRQLMAFNMVLVSMVASFNQTLLR